MPSIFKRLVHRQKPVADAPPALTTTIQTPAEWLPQVSTSNNLPVEILDEILVYALFGQGKMTLSRYAHSHHQAPDLAKNVGAYAAVNKQWQAIVEAAIFSVIRLTPDRIEEAKRVLTPERRACIKTIHLHIVLPFYGEDRYPYEETDEEHQENCRIFTEAIEGVFSLLASWKADQVRPEGVALVIDAYSEGDEAHCELGAFERLMNSRRLDIFDDRYKNRWLDFTSDMTHLPTLEVVGHLDNSVTVAARRNFAPTAMTLVASKMPRLKKLKLELAEEAPQNGDAAVALRKRDDFAASLELLPKTVWVLELNYGTRISLGDRTRGDGDDTREDAFGAAFCRVSQQLDTYAINEASIGTDILWPMHPTPAPATAPNAPFWPNLRVVTIKFDNVAADGTYLFAHQAHGDDNDDPEAAAAAAESLRYLNDFYEAGGRAAQRMPALNGMLITAAAERTPHQFYFGNIDPAGPKQAIWMCRPVFHPEKRVLTAWREAGKKRWGEKDAPELFTAPTHEDYMPPADEETHRERIMGLKVWKITSTKLNMAIGSATFASED